MNRTVSEKIVSSIGTGEDPSELVALEAIANLPGDIVTGTTQGAIEDITLSGTYAGDDAIIAGAINDILAVLRAYGMIA